MVTESGNFELVRIKSEAQAEEALRQAIRDALDGQDVDLKFDGWPTLKVVLKGPGYSGTITAEAAQAIVDLQRTLDRTYARLVRGKATANGLTREQRKAIAFKAKVQEGSTQYEIQLDQFLTTLAEGLVGRMTGTEAMITAVSVALIFASGGALKEWLRSRSDRLTKEAELKSRLELSQEETKRLALVAQAKSHAPDLQQVEAYISEARDSILRGVGDANTVSIQGVRMTQQEARSIAKEPPEDSIAVQLNGYYVIGGIDWKHDERARFDLRSVDESLEFGATLETRSLVAADKAILQKAEWDRTKIHLQINAMKRRGEVVSATIVGWGNTV